VLAIKFSLFVIGKRMFRGVFQIFIFCLLFNPPPAFAAKIGLLVMATGKYISFVPPLIASAEKYFCKGHEVTYFIFTDGELQESARVVRIYQPKLGWPFDTMLRYHVYAGSQDLLIKQDYLFACDADMLFVDEVGNEILGERVATLHPGFVNRRGTYETNPLSLACVQAHEGEYYFAGGFYGGTAQEVVTIAKTLASRIDNDLSRGIIAVWHDESHWNRYCIDHKPTIILSPSYCYPESWNLNYHKRLLALDKNHKEMRDNNLH
jgi:histo-blood group ABO system transferase